jgi:hypothetical protein
MMRGPRASVAIALLAAAAIAAQPACKIFGQDFGDRAYAEANVYSGGVNPGWVLDKRDNDRLRNRLAALPAGGEPVELPATGYRGIVVRNLVKVYPGCEELRVYRGTVTAFCGGAVRTRVDAGRQVERFLAGTGLKDTDPSAYEVVLQDLAAAP